MKSASCMASCCLLEAHRWRTATGHFWLRPEEAAARDRELPPGKPQVHGHGEKPPTGNFQMTRCVLSSHGQPEWNSFKGVPCPVMIPRDHSLPLCPALCRSQHTSAQPMALAPTWGALLWVAPSSAVPQTAACGDGRCPPGALQESDSTL